MVYLKEKTRKGVTMQNLGRNLFIGLILSFNLLFAIGVEATVSSTKVVKGTEVQLRLTAKGGDATFPNIQAIGNAPILSTSKSQQHSLRFINGKNSSEHSTTLTYIFAPQESMTIPSYTVTIEGKPYQTLPIQLTVEAPSTNPNQANGQTNDFHIWMESSKTTALLDEPFIVTFYFSRNQHVRVSRGSQYTPPTFDGFYVKELEKVPLYQKEGRYIEEIRYLLTPKKVGTFTIAPARLKVALEENTQRDIFGMFFNTQWRHLATNSLTIKVTPQPVEADLYGNFNIDATIDKTNTTPNKPVNLTLTLQGEGSLEDFIPPEYVIDGVTIYSDEATIKTEVTNGTLHSTYTKRYAFIADKAFTIPQQHIKQYTSHTKETKVLTIPTFSVKVKGSVQKKQPKLSPNLSTTPNAVSSKTTKETTQQTQTPAPSWQPNYSMLTIAFLLGMFTMLLVGLLYMWLKRKKEPNPLKNNDALQQLYPHITKDKAIEQMVQDLYAKKQGDKSIKIDKKRLKEMLKSVAPYAK
jgi:hypothetical protein